MTNLVSLPPGPAPQHATVTLGLACVRVSRSAGATNWVAYFDDVVLLVGSAACHESLGATVCRAASAAEHSPVLRDQPDGADAIVQLRALSTWSLD